MKKIYTSVLAIFIVFSLTAQNVIQTLESEIRDVKSLNVNLNNTSKQTYDTIPWNDFLDYSTNIISWGLIGGGWIFGTNAGSGTIPGNTFAQGYIDYGGTTFGVVGAMVWVNDAQIISANGCNINIKLARIDGSSVYGPGGGQPNFEIDCPGTVLAQKSFHISDVDTVWEQEAGITFVHFDEPVYIGDFSPFALIFDASECSASGDTIGVFASSDGVADMIYGVEYTWWRYPASTAFWAQLSHIFGSSTRIPAMFAIIDRDYVNVNEPDFFYGLQLTLYPNPTTDILNIAYGLNKSMDTRIEIYDVNGRIIHIENLGLVTEGTHSTTINTNNFAKGNYYCAVISEQGRLIKQFIIQ